jgi:hypothetical protein
MPWRTRVSARMRFVSEGAVRSSRLYHCADANPARVGVDIVPW